MFKTSWTKARKADCENCELSMNLWAWCQCAYFAMIHRPLWRVIKCHLTPNISQFQHICSQSREIRTTKLYQLKLKKASSRKTAKSLTRPEWERESAFSTTNIVKKSYSKISLMNTEASVSVWPSYQMLSWHFYACWHKRLVRSDVWMP